MKMYHPQASEPIEVPEANVENMKRKGWDITKPRKKKESKPEPAESGFLHSGD